MPARFLQRHASAVLCATVLAMPLALCTPSAVALPIFGHKKAADADKPADATNPASPDASPAAAVPQFNEDGTPKLDAAGNPIIAAPEPVVPPCTPSKGHKCPKVKKKKKEKPPKVEPVTISRGIFTVDGVIGKAALNYDIPDLKFIYFYAPGIGVAIISDNKFAGAVEQKDAFSAHTLTVKVAGDHVLQLYSDEIMLSKRGSAGKVSKQNKKAEPAYVAFDSSFKLPTRFPEVGFGKKSSAPYEWPGSKLNIVTKGIDADAPSVPTQLAPKLAANPCPVGQVLMDGKKVVPVAAAVPNATTPPPTLPPNSHLKCIPANQVPVQPKAPEKYIPLDQRPRS